MQSKWNANARADPAMPVEERARVRGPAAEMGQSFTVPPEELFPVVDEALRLLARAPREGDVDWLRALFEVTQGEPVRWRGGRGEGRGGTLPGVLDEAPALPMGARGPSGSANEPGVARGALTGLSRSVMSELPGRFQIAGALALGALGGGALFGASEAARVVTASSLLLSGAGVVVSATLDAAMLDPWRLPHLYPGTGGLAGFGDNEGDAIADKAHTVCRQQQARGGHVARQRHQARDGAVTFDILVGIDSDDTRHLQRGRHVDILDFGVGMGAAKCNAIQHPRPRQIIGETALAGEQAGVLDAGDRLAGAELHGADSSRQANRPA
jgi:hypothetical protein